LHAVRHKPSVFDTPFFPIQDPGGVRTLRLTSLVLVDEFQEKVVLDKEEETESPIQMTARAEILNTHGVDSRVLRNCEWFLFQRRIACRG
jgi:hypothetical protein